MCIIGRLSNLNPAFVMPTLRKVLIQILTELEYSGIGRNKEQSARLLGHLIANAPKLVRPYQEPILKVCVCVCVCGWVWKVAGEIERGMCMLHACAVWEGGRWGGGMCVCVTVQCMQRFHPLLMFPRSSFPN